MAGKNSDKTKTQNRQNRKRKNEIENEKFEYAGEQMSEYFIWFDFFFVVSLVFIFLSKIIGTINLKIFERNHIFVQHKNGLS